MNQLSLRSRCVLSVLIVKQKKPILFKVTEPSSVPYRARSKTEMTEFRTWVGSGTKCFQVLGLSPSLLQDPML